MNRKEAIIGPIRLTKIEKNALLALAKNESVSSAEMVRRLVRDAAKAAGLWPTPQNDRT